MTRYSLRHPAIVLALAASLVLGLTLTSEPAWTDDRDLLRFNTAKPYLFIVLDTSSSMNLKVGLGDLPLPGDGDNPESRIFAAKEALHDVFDDITDVHFGFVTFNQDEVAVRATHWLYFTNDDPQVVEPTWPIAYPAAETAGLTTVTVVGVDTDGDGIDDTTDTFVENSIQGDPLTFGPHIFAIDSDGDGTGDTQTDEYGSCSSPASLPALGDRDREMMNRFSRADTAPTMFWIRDAGQTYRITISVPPMQPDGITPNVLGNDPLYVDWVSERATSCGPDTFDPPITLALVMHLDARLNRHLQIDGTPPPGGKNGNTTEPIPGFFETSDVLQAAGCGAGSPFTGKGWEGNYDSDDHNIALTGGVFDALITDTDAYCDRGNCTEIRPMAHTIYNPLGRATDRGDVLPLDWTTDNKTAFLRRLAPDLAVPSPFGVAWHIADLPEPPPTGAPPNGSGMYPARSVGRPPIIATGETPLGKAILDYRCWWQGSGTNKCRTQGYTHYSTPAGDPAGWDDIACTYDSEWGCRRPYLILISDGEDTCAGESPAADTANLLSKNGVQTWGLNVGDPKGCQAGSDLKKTTQNGGGECINVANKFELRDAIRNILGIIREEARAFASAAVPSVQAEASQSVYLSNFTPLNNKSVWDGHVNAFLKPVPLDAQGRPDVTHANFRWDAGEVMVTQQYDAGNPLGFAPTRRRVFYSLDSDAGKWATPPVGLGDSDGYRSLAPTADDPPGLVSQDLWDAFEIPYILGDVASEAAARTTALDTINNTLAKKTATLIDTGEVIEFLLGDIFHSDPLVIQAPSNGAFLRLNLHDDGTACNEDESLANPGYLCFFTRHRFRRHQLAMGSNDGMIHIFNAAQYDAATERFDDGTGHELFAYMPRLVMPTVREIYLDIPDAHQFTVDGAPNSADAFIDPYDDGAPWPDVDERRWHTVLVGGLREGGAGYFALDMSQPDELETDANGVILPDQAAANYVPSCFDDGSYDSANCGPVPYGSPLWEFTDDFSNQFTVAGTVVEYMDEERDFSGLSVGNGEPDLGASWPQPKFARIRLCDTAGTGNSDCTQTEEEDPDGAVVEKFVTILGGGMDVADKFFSQKGHWIYMVDVETGKTIYKRQLLDPYTPVVDDGDATTADTVSGGAVAGAPAILDFDLDGFADRIYVATIGGYIYRIDLVEFDAAGNLRDYPELTDEAVNGWDVDTANNYSITVKRIPAEDAGGDPVWEPRAIFDSNWEEDPAAPGTFIRAPIPRPFYHEAAVVAVRSAGEVAIGIGTGDREDLWFSSGQEGRFYFFLDDSVAAEAAVPGTLPFTEENFARVEDDDPKTLNNFLVRGLGQNGWFLVLDPDEKIIAEAFSLVGITFFPTFKADVGITDPNGDPILNSGCGSNSTGLCSKTGISRVFLVNATNGNPFLYDDMDQQTRYKEVGTFVTPPYATFRGTPDVDADPGPDDTIDPRVQAELKKLFPDSCRFTNQFIDINISAADTTASKLVPIPICLQTNNWKEF